MKRYSRFLAALGLMFAFPVMVVRADDLTGADKVLCTAVQATVCGSIGECETGNPWLWNVPQFVEVDFKQMTLGTTKASQENRVTPIKNLERKDGLIFLQGIEAGRAFSFVIEQSTGNLSAAVARNEITVSVFGACTPLK